MKDKTVVVFESRAGRQLVESLARRGARTLWAPALAELPDVDPEEIRHLIEAWPTPPPVAVIFQTGVGTAALFATADALGLTPRLLERLAGTLVVARGPKPTAELTRRRVPIDLSAATPFTTHEVLDALRDILVTGRTVLVQRYGESNAELLEALSARGAAPREIATYRWAMPADLAPLESALGTILAGNADAAVFTSASQVRNLLALGRQRGESPALIAALNATLVASIGPVCSRALRDAGITPRVEASPPKLGPLVAALEGAFGGGATRD